MKAIQTITVLAITAAALFSCEKTVVIDSRQANALVVIEGQVTNQPGRQYVKVSRSADFYQAGSTERVTDATVTVTDDLGNSFSFVHNPSGDAETMGFYYDNNFVGQIGRTYRLSVQVDGDVYEAEDKMLAVTNIDSLGYRLNEDELEDPKDTGKYYELLAYMKEPQETEDYYLFKFYRNDSITYYLENSDIYFASDEGIGENIDGIPSPVYFAIGDKARFEVYSLSRNAYLFYNDLSWLINSDGGMISPPPANPRSNLSNGALGLFKVSAVNVATLTISE